MPIATQPKARTIAQRMAVVLDMAKYKIRTAHTGDT